ncbi:hypothetical protein [Paraburkholderia sp. RL17-337-BIB-A]|uniref:hypothetical protein n=1 Tax=Paraburkholderia sp. RL17-337-BIB-A TaxID=3031636 RepID=UPI0038BC1E8A
MTQNDIASWGWWTNPTEFLWGAIHRLHPLPDLVAHRVKVSVQVANWHQARCASADTRLETKGRANSCQNVAVYASVFRRLARAVYCDNRSFSLSGDISALISRQGLDSTQRAPQEIALALFRTYFEWNPLVSRAIPDPAGIALKPLPPGNYAGKRMSHLAQRAALTAAFCVLVQMVARADGARFKASEIEAGGRWIGGSVPMAYLPALDGIAMSGRVSEGIVFYIDPGVDVWSKGDG